MVGLWVTLGAVSRERRAVGTDWLSSRRRTYRSGTGFYAPLRLCLWGPSTLSRSRWLRVRCGTDVNTPPAETPLGSAARCYNWAVIAADIFRPGQWTNFFLLVGTGAVTLTGLVFVAMSLNLKVIAIDATHRYRAINTLTGLALVFMRCALVLMAAQDHQSIGAELFVVCGISASIFVKGYAKAIRMGSGLRLSRIIGGSLVHLTEMIGAALLFFGYLPGLYIAAIAIVSNTCYMITAAWLLVIGAFDLKTE